MEIGGGTRVCCCSLHLVPALILCSPQFYSNCRNDLPIVDWVFGPLEKAETIFPFAMCLTLGVTGRRGGDRGACTGCVTTFTGTCTMPLLVITNSVPPCAGLAGAGAGFGVPAEAE